MSDIGHPSVITQKEGLNRVFDFEKPNIEIVEISDDKKYGKFVVEPLEREIGRAHV